MLRNHFFAEFFCYWEIVIHSQFLFSFFGIPDSFFVEIWKVQLTMDNKLAIFGHFWPYKKGRIEGAKVP